MSNLQVTKSILAKLMATENITVTHQNVKTACFDLKARTLICPIWQEMDGALYDLLMSHEVSHALETPMEGWHSELKNKSDKKERNKYRDFLNVIEDARIEKKVKRRYPGLARSYISAYKGLYDRDFFGIKNLADVNKLNLIDRINLHFKISPNIIIKFSEAEHGYIQEIDNIETWEQVVDLAKRIFQYVKENEPEKIQNTNELKDQLKKDKQENEDQNELDGEDEDEEDDEDQNLSDDEESGNTENEFDNSDFEEYHRHIEELEKKRQQQKEEQKEEQEIDDGEPKSVTDQNFRAREQELINETGEVHMYNLPEADLDNIILENTEVMDDLEKFIRNRIKDPYGTYGSHNISYEIVRDKCVRKFNKNNKKYITHILKEFEMRKKASEYARTTTSRTGELNMNMLHKYKFSNDLFKKINVIQKGKSHGLIMYVDMSGSMVDAMRNTIEQTLVLASFCKLANIPFDVYGFSDSPYNNEKLLSRSNKQFVSNIQSEMHIQGKFMHLKHLIGSSLNSKNYNRSFKILTIISNEYARTTRNMFDNNDNDHGYFNYDWTDGGFSLNSTPYVETLLASRDMIKIFQCQNKLDIVNVLYLTDGCGNTELSFPKEFNPSKKGVVYLIDKKTKKKIRLEKNGSMQSSITKLVADITGCKHLGFYISKERDIKNQIKHQTFTANEYKESYKFLRENKFFISSSIGYNKYFYVIASNKNIIDETLDIDVNMSKSKMTSAFKKTQNSKKNNRILVSKFAEELATA